VTRPVWLEVACPLCGAGIRQRCRPVGSTELGEAFHAGHWPRPHAARRRALALEFRWRQRVLEARELGYAVELVEYVECARAPGLLGAGLGVTLYSAPQTIRIRESLTLAQRLQVLEHELEHARNPFDGERIDREHAARQGRSIHGYRWR
jgi:hypothetical protein